MSCRAEEEGGEATQLQPLLIYSISVRAFKSFERKIKIFPLTPFACIVGPNGTGKSVIGEALAFALGASPKALRVNAFSSLVNHRSASASASAKVSVGLEKSDGSEKVKIYRVLSGSTTKFYWKDDNQAPKREISLFELKQKLASFSIPANNLDRFIVTQNRVSAKIKQPQELIKHLELVIGTAHYEEEIKEADEQIGKQITELECMQQSLSEIELKRKQLSPEVEKWKGFTEKWDQFCERKSLFLRRQEKSLHANLQIYSDQKKEKEHEFLQIQNNLNTLQGSLTKLNLENTELHTILQDCQSKHKIAKKQYDLQRIKMIKEEVQLKEAEKEVALQKDHDQKEQKSLAKREKEVQKEINLLSMDMNELERKKQVIFKEKEESEQKRELILNSGSNNLKLYDSTVQEEAFLTMKIARMQYSKVLAMAIFWELLFIQEYLMLEAYVEALQERLNISNERRRDNISRAAQLTLEIEISMKALEEWHKFEEDHERKVSATRTRLSQLQREITLIYDQKLPRLREEISKNEVEMKHLLKKRKDIQNRADKLSREDEAANVLIQTLKGKLHGRITDLATVSGLLAKAVNSILCHLTNPATTFVVDDRDTANKIISYFQENRIGIATCDILSELSLQFKCRNICETGPYVRPVLQDLQCLENYRPVFQKYFGNWCIAKDLYAATTYFKRKQGYSETYDVVTEDGVIFKKDGEVIAANWDTKGKAAFKSSDDISKQDESKTIVTLEEALKEKAKEKDKLEASLAIVLTNLELIKSQEQDAYEQLQKLRESEKSHLVSNTAAIRSKLEEEQIELDTIKKAVEDDQDDHKIQKEIQHLKQEQMILKSKLGVAENFPSYNPELVELNEKIKQLNEAMRSYTIEMQQKRSSVKMLKNQLETVKSDGKCKSSLSEKLTALVTHEEKFIHTKQQFHEAELQMSTRKTEIEKMKAEVIEFETKISECNKEEKALRSREVFIKGELNGLVASEKLAKEQLRKIILALQDSSRPQLHKKVCHEPSDPSFEALANEAEDEEGLVLAQEEMSLNEMRRNIRADALEEDVKYRKNESYFLIELDKLSEMIESQRNHKDKLENERFNIFTKSVKKLNGVLSKTYQSLTQHGDAYLSFTEEKSLLFSDGVNLQVRPDRHKWRNFNSLSGGQQALASLALSFSLQAMFPSPFYFFDEIDASLDTKNARLVAEYIKNQISAQYIVVSHRPQLYELATSLVGVYHYNGSSTCITVKV